MCEGFKPGDGEFRIVNQIEFYQINFFADCLFIFLGQRIKTFG